MDQNITRVDLETLADGVMLKYWRKGWKEGDSPFGSEVLGGTVFEVCQMLDKQQGFTVRMESAHKGRALRGEITRVDFIKLVDGWKVSKYPYGWTASTRPIEVKIHNEAEFDIEVNIKWCTDHGWIIRQWNERLGVPAGYRAFRDRPQPVRDARMIVFMRNKMPNVQLDFAYDC